MKDEKIFLQLWIFLQLLKKECSCIKCIKCSFLNRYPGISLRINDIPLNFFIAKRRSKWSVAGIYYISRRKVRHQIPSHLILRISCTIITRDEACRWLGIRGRSLSNGDDDMTYNRMFVGSKLVHVHPISRRCE